MFGSKNTRHFVIQSELKPKPIVTRLHTFSRALLRLLAITSSFDWITVLPVSFRDWLEYVITLVLVLRQLIENCSDEFALNLSYDICLFRDKNSSLVELMGKAQIPQRYSLAQETLRLSLGVETQLSQGLK